MIIFEYVRTCVNIYEIKVDPYSFFSVSNSRRAKLRKVFHF